MKDELPNDLKLRFCRAHGELKAHMIMCKECDIYMNWSDGDFCKEGKTIIANLFSQTDCGEGNEVFRNMIRECPPEHLELTRAQWTPTPWMITAETEGREIQIHQWCCRNFGIESSPMHGKKGAWKRGSVTLRGRTWYGFASHHMLEQFKAQFDARPGE